MPPRYLRAVAAAVGIPAFVGSGVTPANIGQYPQADGFIIGSAVKLDGHWANAIDPQCVQAIAKAFAALPTGMA